MKSSFTYNFVGVTYVVYVCQDAGKMWTSSKYCTLEEANRVVKAKVVDEYRDFLHPQWGILFP